MLLIPFEFGFCKGIKSITNEKANIQIEDKAPFFNGIFKQ